MSALFSGFARTSVLLVLGLSLLTSMALASQLDDDRKAIDENVAKLANLDSGVRENAAQEIRNIIARNPAASPDPGEAFWKKKLQEKMTGLSKAEVDKKLPKSPDGWEWGTWDGTYGQIWRRLDDYWVVKLIFWGDILGEEPKLGKMVRIILVEPPQGYSGPWKEYYVDGRVANEHTDRRRMQDDSPFGDGFSMSINVLPRPSTK